jgi:3-oxoacyl-[acyl-carrier protein] reductase
VNKPENGAFPSPAKGVPRQEQVGHEAARFRNETRIWKIRKGFTQAFRGYSQAFPELVGIAALAEIDRSISLSSQVKHLVITGGSGGLGQALIQVFTLPDWEIEAPDRASLELTDPQQIRSWLMDRPVDLLVCAAGVTRDVVLARTGETNWDYVFSVNFRSAADCAKAALPEMIARGRGHIIFISSYSALHPPVGQLAYATAKAALLGLTTSLAAQHGRHGIRVNAILPGFLETRMTETVSTHRKNEILADHTLGRFNTPETVAKFIRHLHEQLPATSGQVFQLDSRAP